ncbi:hypothetical protein BDR26DRAFT_866921 [Obelidium mucronatum]|nr:hypothetical protein BDR26DRAFT_866921 [Obelidium mucronatum]
MSAPGFSDHDVRQTASRPADGARRRFECVHCGHRLHKDRRWWSVHLGSCVKRPASTVETKNSNNLVDGINRTSVSDHLLISGKNKNREISCKYCQQLIRSNHKEIWIFHVQQCLASKQQLESSVLPSPSVSPIEPAIIYPQKYECRLALLNPSQLAQPFRCERSRRKIRFRLSRPDSRSKQKESSILSQLASSFSGFQSMVVKASFDVLSEASETLEQESPISLLPAMTTASRIHISEISHCLDAPSFLYKSKVRCNMIHVLLGERGRPRHETTQKNIENSNHLNQQVSSNEQDVDECEEDDLLVLNRESKKRKRKSGHQSEKPSSSATVIPQTPNATNIADNINYTIPCTDNNNSNNSSNSDTTIIPENRIVYAEYILKRKVKPNKFRDFSNLVLIKDKRPETKKWKRLVRQRILNRMELEDGMNSRSGSGGCDMEEVQWSKRMNTGVYTFSKICKRPGPKRGDGFGPRLR